MIKEAYCSKEVSILLKEKGFDVLPYGSYYVARTGEVFGPKGDIMKPNKSNRGYLRLYLTVNGKRQQVSVHRLVALLFCPNPDMKLEVNHIDGNKENNNASNLEWCTRSENEQHARATGLKLPVIGKYLGKDNKLSKPFVCVETGKVYYCLRELWEELGYDKNCCSHIARACKYGYLDHGYNWRYYEPNELVRLLFEKGYRKYPLSYDGDEWYCYVQMAMKWLREKGIECVVIPIWNTIGKQYRSYVLSDLGDKYKDNYDSYSDNISYKEAAEAALKYALEKINLIMIMDNDKEISFGAFDSELMHQEIFIPEGFEATIDGNKIILKKIESEDERIRKELIEHVKDQQSSFISAPDCRDKYEEEENNKYNSWLSWLEKQGTYTKKDVDDAFVEGMALAKNELEKQGEKKSSDEVLKIRQELYQSGYNDGYKHGCEDTKKQGEQKSSDEDMKEALRTEYEKGRADAFAQMQKSWSEKDEKILKEIISDVKFEGYNNDMQANSYKKINFLKSLKERYTWKPSDEQMRALEYIINNAHNTSYSCKIAKELLEQLRKLKGE